MGGRVDFIESCCCCEVFYVCSLGFGSIYSYWSCGMVKILIEFIFCGKKSCLEEFRVIRIVRK